MVKVKLIGEDSNIFIIMGKVKQALREAGFPEKAQEYQDKVLNASSYIEALAITFDYVDIE